MKKDIIFLSGIFLTLTAIYSMIKSMEEVKAWVPQNLEAIMRIQENELGLAKQNPPTIRFESLDQIYGKYENGEIYLNSSYGGFKTPENSFFGILAGIISFGEIANVKSTLAHELGHFYNDKILEREERNRGTVYLFAGQTQYNAEKSLGNAIISEGIAEYFKRIIITQEDEFEDAEFYFKEDIFIRKNGNLIGINSNKFYRLRYDGGYHLVNPIIREYGVEGIIYISTHAPKGEEIYNLPQWLEKMRKNLKLQGQTLLYQ
ncbi:MAG TPA: hypothetical protein HA360_02860 [Nanoarchaeota archaeon]|nr:hypothetical protein [Candidatus Woesearchaeota archaeon]HIH15362.1 hypothetical protein [Nanoarchaeota archaeon]HIH58990.1 hypothetical protein [Nanoarchaeota archaeon]HII13991.1 hypothetical protein [Nanoarchaeota archaeon]HIJ05483.1 hypothetical protein [Nanoarchaeota archaeon]